MAPAVADAAAASLPPPPPGPGPALGRRDLAAVKALMFPCLAGLWVGGASAAAAAVTHAIHPWEEVPGLILALFFASFGAILFAWLLANVVYLLLLRAAVRNSDSILQACGTPLRSLLRDTAWLSYLAALIFDALSFVGCFVVVVLEIGPRVGRIGTLAIHVGVAISAGISCIDILPSTALKLWRMKPGGAAADGCVV
ncbi:unnamed protein product [Urochloa decumbens]|uniref:Uncharacterized protein n=1 Tax=Urochloa decumbens TaxID=240449 RepID=A0ABC9C2Z7_9POAL